mmetsp:Transcript_31558/g.32040  ORF Transcript_31558/g.32040 Transcript_31558/m.32040 type:complete len:414 (-) Transcript_31558:344-1585(-)
MNNTKNMLLEKNSSSDSNNSEKENDNDTSPVNNLLTWLRLVEPGANLHFLEIIPVYAFAFWFTMLGGAGEWGNTIVTLATTNAVVQLVLFVMVVQIPAYLTGHMSNVDIAWPTGLVLLAAQALHHAKLSAGQHEHDTNTDDHGNDGYAYLFHRSFLIGIALLLHGARMAIGAFVLFFPFDWPQGDLSRYQYAKKRWLQETAAANLWWLKQQQDTIMQAYANSVFIAAPILLVASNPNPAPLRPLEIAGFGCWLASWTMENICDTQMQGFQYIAKQNGDANTAVIGYPPYNGWRFLLWTKSRHPNYFFEWMCWNSILLLAIPSALDLFAIDSVSLVARVGIFVMFFYLSRIFYDCLVYWTGAEPAESRSVTRRPLYQQYQKKTNVFFPFPLPFFNHHRTPGWPVCQEDKEQKNK